MNIDIPEDVWEDISKDDRKPGSYLLATLQINGKNHHLEAIEVESLPQSKHLQKAVCSVCDDILLKYRDAVEAEGPFNTVQIQGRSYVLMVTPYCC